MQGLGFKKRYKYYVLITARNVNANDSEPEISMHLQKLRSKTFAPQIFLKRRFVMLGNINVNMHLVIFSYVLFL